MRVPTAIDIGKGLPTALIGISVWFYLIERPSEVDWLTAEERNWLDRELAMGRREVDTVHKQSIRSAMANPKVWVPTTIFGGIGTGGVGLMLFLPQMPMAQGMTTTLAGLEFINSVGNFVRYLGQIAVG
jgi:ACS family tartrate transporter-like MFS transporter